MVGLGGDWSVSDDRAVVSSLPPSGGRLAPLPIHPPHTSRTHTHTHTLFFFCCFCHCCCCCWDDDDDDRRTHTRQEAGDRRCFEGGQNNNTPPHPKNPILLLEKTYTSRFMLGGRAWLCPSLFYDPPLDLQHARTYLHPATQKMPALGHPDASLPP
jgi:hypothetical protein